MAPRSAVQLVVFFSFYKEQTENKDIRGNAGEPKVLKHIGRISRLLADRELQKARDQKKTWNDKQRKEN